MIFTVREMIVIAVFSTWVGFFAGWLLHRTKSSSSKQNLPLPKESLPSPKQSLPLTEEGPTFTLEVNQALKDYIEHFIERIGKPMTVKGVVVGSLKLLDWALTQEAEDKQIVAIPKDQLDKWMRET